jgi:ElaB/YqjD/DUF883 family membrane-anchored ribosome-binding protein
MVTVQQDIISQNTTEHDSTRDLIRKQMKQAEDLRREMNEIIASVEASLKPFLSSSKRRSEEERKKVQERGKRAEAALEAKRIILEQIEVSFGFFFQATPSNL